MQKYRTPFNRHTQSSRPERQTLDQLDPTTQKRVKDILERARPEIHPHTYLKRMETAWRESYENLEVGLPLIALAKAKEDWKLLEEVARNSWRYTAVNSLERARIAATLCLARIRQPRPKPGLTTLQRTLLAHAAWNMGLDLNENERAAGLDPGNSLSWLLDRQTQPVEYEYSAGL